MKKHSHNRSTSKLSRRKLIKSGSVVIASVAAGGLANRAMAASEAVKPTKVRRLAMVIDLDRCIGCKSCAVACKAENGVRLGGFRSWVSEREDGRYPSVTRYMLPRLCNHCENPACKKVCPVGATIKRPDGLVDIDKSRCIGCRYCMVACPYNARYFNPRKGSDNDQLYPARTRGTVDKCNLCAHRVDNGVVPACVNTCPANARVFGDLNDPDSEVSLKHSSEHPKPLLEEFGTGPSVFYKGGKPQLFSEDESPKRATRSIPGD